MSYPEKLPVIEVGGDLPKPRGRWPFRVTLLCLLAASVGVAYWALVWDGAAEIFSEEEAVPPTAAEKAAMLGALEEYVSPLSEEERLAEMGTLGSEEEEPVTPEDMQASLGQLSAEAGE